MYLIRLQIWITYQPYIYIYPSKNKYTNIYLKYIYFLLRILQIRLHIYILNKNPANVLLVY